METSNLTVRRVALDSLHLDPANAREHGPKNLEAIVASLRRFGQAEPLVVQRSTGRVIGGNGRLVAMKKLGWADCDIVELDVPNRRLDLRVDDREIQRRLAERPAPKVHHRRGYGWFFARHILGADHGCDFDFLRAEGVREEQPAR